MGAARGGGGARQDGGQRGNEILAEVLGDRRRTMSIEVAGISKILIATQVWVAHQILKREAVTLGQGLHLPLKLPFISGTSGVKIGCRQR